MSCNNNLFLYSEAWLDSTGKKYFLIGSSVDGVKDEIGMEQGYPNPSRSKIKLVNKTKQNNQDGYKHHLCCYYHTEKRGGCKWVSQEVYNNKMNLVHFFIGNIPHSEHVMSANMKARALINSPSKLQQTPWRV
jgi:hypothetical protein